MNEIGEYNGYLQSGITSLTKDGNEKMVITFKAQYRKNDTGEWEEIVPFDARLELSFSDKAWEWTEKKLLALGFNNNFDDPDFSDDSKTNGVRLKNKHEEYEGKMREKWELASFGGPAKADESKIKKLQQRWNAKVGKPAGKPAAPPKPRSTKQDDEAEAKAVAASAPF